MYCAPCTSNRLKSLFPHLDIPSCLSLHLKLNPAKTKLYRNNRRQLVTGLVVNEYVGVPREKIREFRTWLHYTEVDIKNGNFYYDDEEFASRLGLLNFYCSVNTSEKLWQWREWLLEIKKKYSA